MLSKRALDYLATLKREPFMPTTEAEATLRAEGHPVFAVWLEFHERYAGYVMNLGEDVGVLGLIHESPRWLDPRKPRLFRGQREGFWYIICADIHPSYDYRLKQNGLFLGGPAESFDTYMEQQAMLWEFYSGREHCRHLFPETEEPAFRDQILKRPTLRLVPEATDQFSRCLVDDEYLVVDNPEEERLRDAWRRR